MSDKQDRTYTRTASELERKYSFGKRFAEILGIATDAREGIGKLDSELASVDARITKTEEGLRAEVAGLSQRVNMTMSAEMVRLTVSEAIDGIKSITTETGYTFGSDGMRIRKSGDEMENLLDETGMYVNRITGEETDNILTANNEGVSAINVSVRKYLIIGKNSRIEDYEGNRTACFWIGGT